MKIAQVVARQKSAKCDIVSEIISVLNKLPRDEVVDKNELGRLLGMSGKYMLSIGTSTPAEYTMLIKIGSRKTRYWGHPEAIKKIKAMLDGQIKNC